MTFAKTVLITGTNSGIGQATSKLFRDRGWRVIATQRRLDDSDAIGSNAMAVPLELTDSTSVENAARMAIDQAGRIDVLINNAGSFQMGPIETSTMAQIRTQFEANFFGLVALSKMLIPHMREHGGGTIVNIGSISAENGYPFASAYSASKAAVVTLSEALNLELDCADIRVKTVLPGQHATKIFTKIDMAASIPQVYQSLLARFIDMQKNTGGSSPEECAATIYRAVTDKRRDVVRYFSGPDANAIPFMKRLMGHTKYFKFFRKTILDGPGPVVRALSPKFKQKVEVSEKLDKWGSTV